eukprot:Gregarina_sp_Poly_1__1962@NODE_1512_length_3967_cov_63_832308_g1003_i0_p3_GENE_NODE_1512_length_3967_cov_63_832308_g1003_i0NODE_1512_length_3967_cov_63_832308_g1003_i0_p3_ORF_typecomplete_len178_score8_71_NODE_1512_length_3967_cov_63_832308_g1003_i0260793
MQPSFLKQPLRNELGEVHYYPHGVNTPVRPTHVEPEALQVAPGMEYAQYQIPNPEMKTRLAQSFPGEHGFGPSGLYPGQISPYEHGVHIDPAAAAQGIEYPHYVHVPVFRTRKRVYIKKQSEGCCGCINDNGYCDNPGGFLCFPMLNIAGCLDRDRVVKVDRYGNPVRHKKTYTHRC